MRQTDIRTSNENQVTAQIYEAEKNAVLIISSATGVKQSFYKKFAEFISSSGITVITFDYTGIGLSIKHSVKQIKTSAFDWGKHDLESVITFAKQNYPTAKITLLGHSIGGQIIGLARSSSEVQKIILIAAQSGYWKFWKRNARIKMWFNWHVIFPVLIGLFGYVPSKRISGMEDLPEGVARQWSGWGRNPNYLFDEVPQQDLYYDTISANMTAISIDKDFYAPKEAVDWLTGKYINADVKKLHLFAKDYNVNDIGHFGIFRDTFQNTLWKFLLNEIAR